MKNLKKLTEKEEELMTLLWDNGPMYVREMLDHFDEPKPHFNTVSTFVRLLEQKGFVAHERTGNSYRYYPVVSRDDYSRLSLRSVMERYFDNSVGGLVSALVSERSLSDDELRELMAIVSRAAGSEEGK